MIMKRLDLTSTVYYEVIDKLDIRPSLKLKINYYLSQNGIKTVCALCGKSEDELLAVPCMSEETVVDIKDYLETAGLRLGMTDDELFDYFDADYLKGMTTPHVAVSVENDKGEYVKIPKGEWLKAKSVLQKMEEGREKLGQVKHGKRNCLASLLPYGVMLLVITPPLLALLYFLDQTFGRERPKVEIENVRSYESIRKDSGTIDYPMFDGRHETGE